MEKNHFLHCRENMCKTPENLKYNENDALRMNTKPEMMATSNVLVIKPETLFTVSNERK